MNHDKMADNKTSSGHEDERESKENSRPRDDRFADPGTDEDPRTSDVGVSSIGASDLNADTATADTSSPESVPGVRNG